MYEKIIILKKTTVIVALSVSLLIVGCASSAKKLNDISVGMSKADVVNVLGSPETVRAQYGTELLIYNLSNWRSSDAWYAEYYVELRDGTVVSYGKR
jgi:outer membrane protein assembly factor BamE (lipoprotein component of BamABCDE complex)